MDKIITELKQFKCYNYDEWLALSNYIPSQGEICGVIIQQDSDINTNFNIPDGYEILDPPYTLLKMGNGINNIAELPWISSTESEVIQNIVSKIFNGELEGTGTELLQQYINDYLGRYHAESIPDWDEIDRTNLSYINNKPFGIKYNSLNEPIVYIPDTTLYGDQLNSDYYLLDSSNLVQDLQPQVFNKYDIFNITINNQTFTKTLKEFTFNGSQIFYLGNLGYLSYLATNEEEKNLYSSLDITSDQFLFICHVNNNKLDCSLIAHLSLLSTINGQEYSAPIKLSLIKKNIGYKTIDNEFLPDQAVTLPNFLENNPTAPSYIKNKICNIISYKEDNALLSSKNIELDNPYNIEIELNLQEPLNFYNTYKISIGKYVYENLKYDFIPLTISNQTTMVHTLGNLFILYDEIKRTEESIGVVSESTLKMLKAYPDNGQDILVILNSNKNQVSGTIYRRESKPVEEPQSINVKSIAKHYISPYEISLAISINEAAIYNKGYIKFSNQFYQIDSIKDSEQNGTIITLASPITETIFSDIDTLHTNNYFQNFELIKTVSPDIINTIGLEWLPEEIKVGRNDNSLGEIFNDYQENEAKYQYSHAEGKGTITHDKSQHVQGRYNTLINNAAFIIGNGTSNINRSNAYSLDWQGNSLQAGKATAQDFISYDNKHILSQKENTINKVNTIAKSSEIEFPTTQAVINYIQNLLNITPDNNGNITLEFTSIDGNGIYK